jgi:tetratricopeptide (TPR) repeat protein
VSEEQTQEETLEPSVEPKLDPVDQVRSTWRDLWQIPTTLAAVALLVASLGYAFATKPDPDFSPAFKLAGKQIEREEYPQAIETLNTRILPYVGKPIMTNRQEGHFYQLLARAVFGGQKAMGVSHEANYRNALSAMRKAESDGAKLTDKDQAIIAECYLALGEIESAATRAEQISGDSADIKLRITRRIVDKHLAANPPRYDDASDLLAQMLSDTTLKVDDRAWAIGRQAEIEIAMDLPETAITRLLRAMPRMSGASPLPRARLQLLLANAYLDGLATDQANLQIDLALKLIPDGSPEQAEAKLLRARVQEQREDYAAARDQYIEILDRFQPDYVRVRAQHGLALMEATLAQHESAQLVFEDLAAQVRAKEPEAVAKRDELLDSLLSIFRDQLAQQDVEVSFRYAQIAGRLYPLDSAPPQVLKALGVAHRVMADRVVALAPKIDGPLGPELDPSTEREVQRLRIQAATFFRMHARAFLVTNLRTYADSLWQAGVLYDQAGDQQEAAAVFRQFAKDLPTDPRQPEARFRLAQTLGARGQYRESAEIYQKLIDDRDRGLDASGLGRFAAMSHVPLAQVYLLDDDPDNDDNAQLLLERVLAGDVGGPDNQHFVPALTALAELWFRRGEHARAIEGFEEALARADGQGDPALRFNLAESYRLNARDIDAQLENSLTDKDRKLLTQTRQDNLLRAMDLYESARKDLEATHPQRRNTLDNLYLRNAYFYLGDCAFDLGDTERAVRLYNSARERYPSDPASLVALVQIVNAYVREGNLAAARTANERARLFFEGLPEEVWDDPNLPMTRRDWERWLESSSVLYASGNAEP